MQSLQQSSALEKNAFQTAMNSSSINQSKDNTYSRGTKRLRVGSDGSDDREDIGFQHPGRSFLETKWDSEMRKRREFGLNNVGSVLSLTTGCREITRRAF